MQAGRERRGSEVIIAVFDEDGTRDAAVTNLDLPRPTFRARDLHNQST